MTTEDVKSVLIKAINDELYKELLFSDPSKALEGYELTDEEVAALKNLEREQYDAMAAELEDRVSRAGLTFGIRDGILTAGETPHDKKITDAGRFLDH